MLIIYHYIYYSRCIEFYFEGLAYAESRESFCDFQKSHERVSDTLNPAVLEDVSYCIVSINALLLTIHHFIAK